MAKTGVSARLAVVGNESWEHVLVRETLDLDPTSR
jgi:hypothetical protein